MRRDAGPLAWARGVPASRRAWTRAAAAFVAQIDPLDRFAPLRRSLLPPPSRGGGMHLCDSRHVRLKTCFPAGIPISSCGLLGRMRGVMSHISAHANYRHEDYFF